MRRESAASRWRSGGGGDAGWVGRSGERLADEEEPEDEEDDELDEHALEDAGGGRAQVEEVERREHEAGDQARRDELCAGGKVEAVLGRGGADEAVVRRA